MISRHISCQPGNDDYRRLARYIADTGHDGEKSLMSWCAGCWSGDDEYELAIKEVELVQAMNIRTTKEKTYHLVISFRPEDESKLTPEIFKAIELEFAQALGFSEHQRHCGVHKNTANMHLHISYNQIHPESKKRHEPFRDFWKRDQLCRQLEQKYGLTVDNGRDPESDKSVNDAAMTFETQTGQESLSSYAQRHKSTILSAVENAKAWSDCHQTFFKYGLTLKLHGNGMVIQTTDGRHSIKASELDRSISKAKLEKRFGAFIPPSSGLLNSDCPIDKYTAAPLHKKPDRDALYEHFKEAMAKRQAALSEVSQQDARLYAISKQGWDKKRAAIKKMPMMRTHRQKVMKELRVRERAERTALRKTMKQKREAIRAQYTFNSWNQFLQHHASQGNETALAVLRLKKTKAQPGSHINTTSNQPDSDIKIITVASIDKMRELLRQEGLNEPRYNIDTKGTIIFHLPDGASIRDTGNEIHYSHNCDLAKVLATKLSQDRWGPSLSSDGNAFENPLLTSSPQQQQSTCIFNNVGR